MTAEKPNIPDWAQQERHIDMGWIRTHIRNFWPRAKVEFEKYGRGALAVDVNVRSPGGGHPFFYFPENLIEELKDDDIFRLVCEYDPEKEFIIALFKTEERASIYWVQPLYLSR